MSWHTHGMWYSYQGAANEVWMQHASMCTGHETGTVWSGDSMEERVNMCAVVALTAVSTPCNSQWRLECGTAIREQPMRCGCSMPTCEMGLRLRQVWNVDMEEAVNMCGVALTDKSTTCNSQWRLECFRSADCHSSPCHIQTRTLWCHGSRMCVCQLSSSSSQ